MASDHVLVARAERDNAYRDRARVTAVLAGLWPSVIVRGADESCPRWWVLFVDSPAGQLSWHVHPNDRNLFTHVAEGDVSPWDGHSSAIKAERLNQLSTGMPVRPRKVGSHGVR